jgi:flagellin
MAMDISLTSAARQSLLSLQDISNQMSVLQKRLATGKRVNTPIDDPITYFTWSALSSRAASLDTVLTGITGAQSTIQAANKGLAALQSLISSAQSLANQAQQSPNTLVKVTGTNSTALTTASVIATTAGAANRFKAGDTLTVSDGTTTATYTAANNDTVQTIMTAINGTAGLKAAVTLNASGQLQIAATNTVNIAIGGTLTGAGTLTGIVGLTAGTTSFVANPTRQSLAAQYDNDPHANRPGGRRRKLQRPEPDQRFDGFGELQRDRHVEADHHRLSAELRLAGPHREREPVAGRR